MDPKVVAFGSFELDWGAYQLRRHGRVVALERIPLELLLLLVDRAGELCTREEIRFRIWGEGVFLDVESAINTAVRKVRRALNDRARNPRFIARVQGKGYRFVGSVNSQVGGHAKVLADVNFADADEATHRLMVGRERELTRLLEFFRRAKDGARQVVFVAGEIGIGKTTLARSFLGVLQAGRSAHIGHGQCIEQYGSAEPYMPVLEALTRLCRESGGRRFIAALRRAAPAWIAQMPRLGGAERPDHISQELSHSTTQQRMLREMTEALEMIAAEQPLVLLFEDLHWSDPSTLELIALVARRTEPTRLLILGTYRPTELVGPDHPLSVLKAELKLHGQCEELRPELLNEKQVGLYLERRLAGYNKRPLADLTAVIYRRSEGNPLFMANLVGYVMAHGSAIDTGSIALPNNIREIILNSWGRLTLIEQRVLDAASVAGAEFSAATVAAALGLSLIEIERCCRRLASREQFLERQGPIRWPDGTTGAGFRFRHVLYQNVLYDSLTEGDRIELHRRIAERHEAAFGSNSGSIGVELAHHFQQAGNDQKAVYFLQQAAERAVERAAYAEATDMITTALSLLDTLPDEDMRNRTELALRGVEGTLGFVVYGASSNQRERAIRRMGELADHLGAPHEIISAQIHLSILYFTRGEAEHGLEIAGKMLALAREVRDIELMAEAQFWYAALAYSSGKLEEAATVFEEAFKASAQLERRTFALGARGDIVILSQLAPTLHLLGRADDAVGIAKEGLRRARESRHAFSLAMALCLAGGWLALDRHDPEAVITITEELIALSDRNGFAEWLPWGRFMRGWALSELGKVREGLDEMGAGLDGFTRLGGVPRLPYLTSLRAWATVKLGRVEEALPVLDEISAKVNGEQADRAEIWRVRGEMKLRRSRIEVEDVEQCFRTAQEIARGQSSKWWELRATTSLARLLRDTGRRDEARTLLTEIYGWFTGGFDTKDLKEAKALLDELRA